MPGIDWSTIDPRPQMNPVQILNSMRRTEAEQHGALTAEEGDKYIAAKNDIANLGWRNVDILWTEQNGQRKLSFAITLYSNVTHQEIFYGDTITRAQLTERGLDVDREGDVDREDMIGTCECCGDRLNVEKMEHMVDADELWCHDCAQENGHRCEHCGAWYKYSDDFEEVYRDYDNYEGYWCPDCQREAGAYWDEDDEKMYIDSNTGGRM